MKEPMNLIGKRFGKLTVIDKADSLFYKNEKYKILHVMWCKD